MALAKRLGWSASYIEGDELHPRENVEKMSRGVPLTDEDRGPWLEVIREKAVRRCFGLDLDLNLGEGDSDDADTGGGKGGGCGRGVVVTCSALKKSYRDILRGRRPSSTTYPRLEEEHNPPTQAAMTMQTYFVWINGSKEVLQDRIGKRQGHFFKAAMLDSQLKTLEIPEGEAGVVVVPLEVDTDEQVRIAVDGLRKLNIL
jgi:gluconokinase